MKNKADYIASIVVGNLIAFTIDDNMLSGKVIEILDDGNFVVKTINSSIYYVKPENVKWVKNGSHWPVGIYQALRYNQKSN